MSTSNWRCEVPGCQPSASHHRVELFEEDGPGAEPAGSFPSESFGNTWLPAFDHASSPGKEQDLT